MKNSYLSFISSVLIVLVIFFTGHNLNAQDSAPFASGRTFLDERLADYNSTPRQHESRKSVARATIYSLIVPGMGELYADNFSTGKYLLGSEITLWLTVYGFHSYGNWIRNDAESFAAVHANTDWSGKDDQFFVNVGNFNSWQEYNEKKMRDRDIGAIYTDDAYSWNWESDEKRREFRDMRVRSDQMLNAVKFVGAAIVANHIISAIIAGNSASRYNDRLDNPAGASNWSFGVVPHQYGFVAGIQHTF